MARSFLGIFAKSPFTSLQALGQKVRECAEVVPELFDAYFDGDHEQVALHAERLSQLEYEADQLKNQARAQLPRAMFMPVDRRDFIDVLSALGAIADCAEDIGILFTLRRMEPYEELIEPLKNLVKRVMTTVRHALDTVDRLEALSRSGFASRDAENFLAMIDELGRLEHAADIVQDDLARKLFSIEDKIKPGSLLIWNKIFNKVGDMANHSERMGNRMRLFLS